jgi:hypothetical protein
MNRTELITAYTKYKVSQMDRDALVNVAEIMLRDAYKHLSDDALIDELSEYAPHLIKVEMKL